MFRNLIHSFIFLTKGRMNDLKLSRKVVNLDVYPVGEKKVKRP